jgi:hypothetical protein
MGGNRLSKEWQPDNSFLQRGGRAGINKVNAALRKNNLSLKNIITSRDFGVDMARYALRREPMPPGWFSWQLPFYLLGSGPTFFFMQTALPGSILPTHQHEVAQFRLVLYGGVIYTAPPTKKDPTPQGIHLGAGDWIYTPENAEYTLSVATNPGHTAGIFYCY